MKTLLKELYNKLDGDDFYFIAIVCLALLFLFIGGGL